MNSLIDILHNWNKSYDSRQKLQHAYIVSTIAVVVIAGLVGLINGVLGHRLLAVASVLAGTFLINAVVWALVDSAVIGRIKNTARKTPVKPKAKK